MNPISTQPPYSRCVVERGAELAIILTLSPKKTTTSLLKDGSRYPHRQAIAAETIDRGQ